MPRGYYNLTGLPILVKTDRNGFEGKKHSEETKKKLKASHLGTKHSEETRRKMSLSHKRTEHLRDYRIFNTPEWKKKQRIAQLKYWEEHPEMREKRSQEKLREKHPNWLGGASNKQYPLGWHNTFREQIRYKNGYKCKLCGCHEAECDRKLHVHHIDYNKMNIDESNLIPLCVSCHMKTNYSRDKWKNLFSQGVSI